MSEEKESPIRSVDRALEIIEVLAKHPKGMGLLDLSREVCLNKTTTYRMLCAIMAHGWIAKEPTSGHYRLTLMLFELGSKVSARMNVLTVARPFLDDLSAKFGKTVHLVIQDGTDVVYLYKEDSPIQSIKMGSQVGNRYPMYCTGVGKAILAYLNDDELEEIWNSSRIIARTSSTITELSAMKDELEIVRQRGWAMDNEENEIGVRCIAAPVLNRKLFPVAAISISSSVFHITDDKFEIYSKAVIAAAKAVSQQLGI
jgi:IclR family transcriptional regulator, KDG regulon repressor